MRERKSLWNLLTAIMVVVFSVCAVSCSDDDDEISDDVIVGTWSLTQVEVDGTWHDVTTGIYRAYGASITFHSDGTYYGSGSLGYGSGTWKKSGSTITTYVDDEVYITYNVSSLTETSMSGSMTQGKTTMNFKAEKR